MATFSFKLTDSFINEYKAKSPKWGYTDAGGNSIGELTFIRTYSRVKPDGTKERWWEVCQRVIEGMYSIQKDHCKQNRLPWNDHKSQRSAQEAYERLFELKWTPPGRGLWMMGTDFVMERKIAAALQNCAFCSTKDIDKSDPGALFAWAMDALMLGVGVGFDTLGADKDITINIPSGVPFIVNIEDSREGWVDSVRLQINSYMKFAGNAVKFDYSDIRPYGSPIGGFGGTSSGAGPLIKLHEKLDSIFTSRIGAKLDSRLIVDIMNLIGTCVVSGNVRRSALLAMGLPDDQEFINLKNVDMFPERNSYDPENPGWGWMSNNSLSVSVGQEYNGLIDRIASNGEPGLIWLDITRKYGRLVDPPDHKDYRVSGYNPCCVSADTMIMTTDGPQRICDIDGEFTAFVDGEKYSASQPWISGVADIYRLSTDSGYELDLTLQHNILTQDGEWVQAQNLKPGDKIRLNNHRDVSWGRTDNFGEGYLLGHFIGDGNFSRLGQTIVDRNGISAGSDKYSAHLKVWDFYGDDSDIVEYSYKIASQLKHRSDWKGWSQVLDRPYQSMSITPLTKAYNVIPSDKHNIRHLESESSEFYKGFLRGVFDADGHVEGWDWTGGN